MFSSTTKLLVCWMRMHTMDKLIRQYLLNINFGQLSLINVALKSLVKRIMAELMSKQIA